MASGDKRTGMAIPSGILQSTMPRDPEPVKTPEPGQGGAAAPPTPAAIDEPPSPEGRAPRVRRKRTSAAAGEKLEGRRLYLSEDVHFRLRMLAYQRGRKLSEVAQEVLDKALPRYDVNRVG